MAYWDFIKRIRQDEEEEKKRDQRGGFGNRIYGFLDDVLDVGEKGVGIAAGLGREVLVKPTATAVQSLRGESESQATEAITKSVDELRKLSYEDRKKAFDDNEGLRVVFGNRGITDPTDENLDKILETRKQEEEDNTKPITPESRSEKILFGNEPIKSYQQRYRGLKEGEDQGGAGWGTIPALIGTGVNIGLDSPLSVGLDDAVKAIGKKGLKELSETGSKEAVEKLLKGKVPEKVVGEISEAISKTKDPKEITRLIRSAVPRKVRAGLPEPSKLVSKARDVADSAKSKIDDFVGAADISADSATRKISGAADDVIDGVRKNIPGGVEPPNAQSLVDVVTPGNRQRGLLRTTQASEQLDDVTKKAIGEVDPQTYPTMNIQKTLDAARDRVKTDFGGVKEGLFKKLDANTWDDEVSSNAIALLEDANSRGDAALAREIMEKAAPQGTRSGQANVLWRTFVNSNTPEGMVKFAKKVIDDANRNMGFLTKKLSRGGKPYSLSDEAATTIKQQMERMNKLADGPEKDEIMKGIMRTINDQVPPGASEFVDAYRYQNMLSGPRTQARNIVGNAFQAGVVTPITKLYQGGGDFIKAGLFGKERQNYVKDVPDYYKGMLNSLPDAIEEFKRGWAGDIQQPDLKKIGAYANEKVPKALTIVGRAMEAQDRFFQALVRNGEFAVQKAKGVADDVALEEADKLGKYAVFRQATDAKNATGQGALLSKIDAITDSMTELGRKHKAFRWFVPFIQTPANISKQMVEYSPAGFATLYKSSGKKRGEQIARASLGSTMTAIGAMLAYSGDTTWAPPENRDEREAFYSSGKKPYSIRIGDTWVPMIYFGPLGYSLGIPAAIKDANDRGEVDDTILDKGADIIAGQAQFFTQQTYLQGVQNFVNAITGKGSTGDLGKDLSSAIASTAGQLIPLQSFSRYVNSAIDPVIRKKKGAVDTFAGDIPVAGGLYSKNLEANKDVFTGEDARRNASDYVAPYSMGKDAADPNDADFQEGVGEFYKIRSKVSKQKSKADDYVTEALERGDYQSAYAAAEDFNAWVQEQFDPWGERYGQRVSPELQAMYDRLKISTKGLRRRRKNALEREEQSTINYR